MDLLLDTHTFIWFVNGETKLSGKARKSIENIDNQKFLSVASMWEMAIKISLGKLNVKKGFKNVINQINENNFEILPITFDHTLIVSQLIFHHHDPFDRLIILQAITENMIVVTKDKNFEKYEVELLW